MPTATLTSKGQVTMPLEIRKMLRLVPGSKVDFVKNDAGEIVLRRTKTGDIRALRGILKYDGPPASIEEMNQAIGRAIVESFKRSVS